MISYPHIDPVILKIGPLSIHWYGLMYILGFTMAWILGSYRCRRSKGIWDEKIMADLIFYGSIGVILGGRIGYVVFYNLDYFLHNPLKIVAVWDGGMSFHGGFIGVLLSVYLFGKTIGKGFVQMTDFIAPLVPFGLGTGRLGNFINGELWGRPTNQPWAMIFPNDPTHLPRHPSQIYEFLLEGVLLFLVLWFFSSKKRPVGAVSALFLIVYGTGRFFVEFYREPDPQLGFRAFNWLTRGQQLSLPMILGGIVLLIFVYSKKRLIEHNKSSN